MKRYDQNAFTVVALLCGLALLLSCSTNRQSHTAATFATRDTTRIHQVDSATTAAEVIHREAGDTLRREEHATGSLRIERDTAGRPVLYVWDTSALMRAAALHTCDFSRLSGGTGSYRTSDSTATSAANVEEEEEKATRVGPGLEYYFGVTMLIYVVGYVVYLIIASIWRNRRK